MFKGNPDIRASGEKIVMTLEQQKEYLKCANDIFYFIENYFNIVTLDEGIKLFEPYEYQRKTLRKIIDNKNEEETPHLIALWPRQMGKCVSDKTKITIRNKKTKEIEEISIGEFYSRVKNG